MKRQIIDSRGARWDVWEVDPNDLGRFTYDRRGSARPDATAEPDPAGEGATGAAAHIAPELRRGWLCFQCGTERRRFAPTPPGWHQLPDSVLRVMLDVAAPVARQSGETTSRPTPES